MNKLISNFKILVLLPSALILLSGCSNIAEPPDRVHGNKGTKYWEQRKFDLAEKEMRKAIELNPKSSLWYQNLGVILNSAGRREEAIQSFKYALDIDNEWGNSFKTSSLMEVGYHYFSERNYQKSISTLETALDTATKENVPSDTLKLLYLYLSYNFTDATPEANPFYDLEKAHTLKEKAYKLDPRDLYVKASITKLLVLQNKINLAENNIQEIETELENNEIINRGNVYAYLSHIYSLLKDSHSSADAMSRAITISPKHASDYLLSELNNDFQNVAHSEEMKPVIEKAKRILEKK